MPMPAKEVRKRSVDLMTRLLRITSGIDLPRGDDWPTLVTVSLSQANMRLRSVFLLLNKGDEDSAVILTRSLFELAVNLSYIFRNIPERLPQYLRHGGIPLTNEEMHQIQQEVEKCGQPDVNRFKPWKPVRKMCEDLGDDWVKEYETFYRYASVPTHAGAFTLGRNYLLLLKRGASPVHEKTVVRILLTALDFHLRLAEIAAKTFPRNLDFEKIAQLHSECNELGLSLPLSRTQATCEDRGRGL